MAKMKKFDFYLLLRELGIKEKHAVSMTKQAKEVAYVEDTTGRLKYVLASDAVEGFAQWETTEEGADFWQQLYDKFHNEEQRL